jgi:RimJ/RimL family protein N-acetyltransferase
VPAFTSSNFTLKNGLTVLIRPVRPEDGERLQQFVGRLSDQTTYLRFHKVVRQLTPQEVHKFTHLDYTSQMGLVAVRPAGGEDGGEEKIIGVARYAAQGTEGEARQTAEVGVVVEDAYQSQGLGRRLLKLLTRIAVQNGIRVFTGTALPENEHILDVIESFELRTERHYEDGAIHVQIFLPPSLPATGALSLPDL